MRNETKREPSSVGYNFWKYDWYKTVMSVSKHFFSNVDGGLNYFTGIKENGAF